MIKTERNWCHFPYLVNDIFQLSKIKLAFDISFEIMSKTDPPPPSDSSSGSASVSCWFDAASSDFIFSLKIKLIFRRQFTDGWGWNLRFLFEILIFSSSISHIIPSISCNRVTHTYSNFQSIQIGLHCEYLRMTTLKRHEDPKILESPYPKLKILWLFEPKIEKILISIFLDTVLPDLVLVPMNIIQNIIEILL